jgi:hypothetical protein
MTEAEARAAAEALLATFDMKGYSAVFAEAKTMPRFPGEWIVIFDMFSPEGTPFDGPMVVTVDEKTKEATMMEGP